MSVSILMGSDSDLPAVQACLDTLRELDISFDARVLSAHRTPDDVVRYVTKDAPNRGTKVFICCAGGAAHLAGVVAAHTALPVLGVPLELPPMGGLDALLATVQMPGGVPVACFGNNRGGPINAGLFAARILAIGDPALAERVERHRSEQTESVRRKDARLQEKLG